MSNLCKKCGKPPLAERAGSFTSYLFLHNYCQCDSKTTSETKDNLFKQSSWPTQPASQATENPDVCGHCGKALAESSRSGSFTSFLFKDLRCQCKVPLVTRSQKRTESRHTNTGHRASSKKQFTQQVKQQFEGIPQSGNTQTSAVLPPGTMIGGTFKILSVIGAGGMGVVYAAAHTGLNRRFALKVLSPELVNDQTWKRFQAEAKTLASLHHNSLVSVFDLGIHERALPYYSMDLLTGRTLEQILEEEGPLYLDEAIEIFLQVLDGLAYAHRNNIIHRDLKPGNIMVCTIDGELVIKILDFGISKFLDRSQQGLTMVGETFGSPFYMSPEQCSAEPVDARSDIYSIGCTMFEALTTRVPFEGQSSMETVMMHEQEEPPRLADVDPDGEFPESIEYVVAKCLEKRPDERYQSAKELAIDLERVRDKKFSSAVIHEKKLTKHSDDRSFSVDAPTNSRQRAIVVLGAILTISGILVMGATAYYAFKGVATETDKNLIPKVDNFYSKIVDNGSTIQFNFPDVEIGIINTKSKIVQGTPARGIVRFPAQSHLVLFTNEYSSNHPEVFNNFKPDDLYNLILRAKFESKENLQKTLIAVQRLTGLKKLEVSQSDFGDSEIDLVNNMTNLDALNMNNTEATADGIKRFTLLRKLNFIFFDLNKNLPELLQVLKGSQSVTTLFASTADKPNTMADIELIKTLSNLDTLNLENNRVSDEMLLSLASMPKLRFINVRGGTVTQAGAEAATKLHEKLYKQLAKNDTKTYSDTIFVNFDLDRKAATQKNISGQTMTDLFNDGRESQ